jgi:hypothetical protein
MTISFPQPPLTTGQIYQQWQWDGTKWVPLPPASTAIDGFYSGFVNKLRNGTFDIWQRGTSGGTTANTYVYTADGWVIGNGAAGPVNFGQQVGRGPTRYAMFLTGAAGSTAVTLNQRIESYISAALGTVPVTFQMQIYNNTGATFTPTLAVSHPSTADTSPYAVVDLAATNMQPCPNGAWTRIAYTFTVLQASANLGLQIVVALPALTTGAQAIAVTEADLRATPSLPVGLCADPPTPEMRPIAAELAFCQRYFYQGLPPLIGLVPGSATSIYRMAARHPVPMRAAPTITMVQTIPVFDGVTNTTIASVGASYSDLEALQFDAAAAAAFAAGVRPLIVPRNDGGIMSVSAEL